MRIFIDTEFTDFIDCHLISLGMVSEFGEEFYREVPCPEKACSAFVREAIIPLLNQDLHAHCSKTELKIQMLEWFKLVRNSSDTEIKICFDYQSDWDLFVDVLDGEIPKFIHPCLINSEISDLLLYDFWKNSPDLREHHALNDARANAYAFRKPKSSFPMDIFKLFGNN